MKIKYNCLTSHPYYSAFLYIFAGIGVGILLTYPFVGSHPLRWAILFLSVSLIGHLYPYIAHQKR